MPITPRYIDFSEGGKPEYPLNTGEIKYWNSVNVKYYTRLGFSDERPSELITCTMCTSLSSIPPVLPKFAVFFNDPGAGKGKDACLVINVSMYQ